MESHCRCRWVSTVLRDWGWRLVDAWQWRPDMCGDMRWNQIGSEDIISRYMRLIHESWRRAEYASMAGAARRDTAPFQIVPYNEAACKKAQRVFRQADAHVKAVMSRAALSDSDAYNDENPRPCETRRWCFSPCAPGWRHLCWECPHIAGDRPRSPECPLPRWFAWPTHADNQFNVLVRNFLAAVGCTITEARH